MCTNRVSILPGRTKLRFSRKCNSLISNPNETIFTMEDAIFQIKVNPFSHSQDTSKLLKKFFVCSSFHTLNKNRCNLQILTPNWLKFITPFGGPRVNLSINFWANLIKISRVVRDFPCKTKSHLCHTCRLPYSCRNKLKIST